MGSVVGSFTYDYGYKKALSFCIDTGFTLFGLVEQDDIIKQMGLKFSTMILLKLKDSTQIHLKGRLLLLILLIQTTWRLLSLDGAL